VGKPGDLGRVAACGGEAARHATDAQHLLFRKPLHDFDEDVGIETRVVDLSCPTTQSKARE